MRLVEYLQDFRFELVPGLSREVVQRLTEVRPDTLGHALRVPGSPLRPSPSFRHMSADLRSSRGR